MHYFRNKYWLIVLACLTIVVFMAGCSSNETESGAAKDTLVVAAQADPDGFDPHNNVNFCPIQIKSAVFETLFEIDENMQVIPWLAESYEWIDDMTLQINVRKGVKFHDGTELTAEDVLFSLARCVDTQGYVNISKIDFENSKVLDDYTVELKMLQPCAIQIELLEFPLTAIFSKAVYEEYNGDFSAMPVVGTGPYKLVNYVPGDRVEFTAFEDYWQEGYPVTPNLTYRVITETASRAIEVETGGADIGLDIGASDISRLSEETDKVVLLRQLATNTCYINMNTAIKPFDDIRVRQAVAYAMDRDALVSFAYQGTGAVATGYGNPNLNGYLDLSDQFYERDIEKAKALLAEAGYPNGFSSTIFCESSTQQRVDLAEALQSQLAEVGIDLEVSAVDATRYTETCLNGNAPMSIYAYSAPTGEMGKILMRFLSDSSDYKIRGWSDSKYDEVLNQALATLDPDARYALFQEAQQILWEGLCAVPIWDKELIVVTGKDVDGFKINTNYETHWMFNVGFKE